MKKYVTDEEIIHLTRELVRTPSVNPPADTRQCADLILNAFRREQIESDIIEGKTGACNVVARLPGKGRGKTLLLNGHMDVVPPGEDWTVDPFGAEIRDNKNLWSGKFRYEIRHLLHDGCHDRNEALRNPLLW